MWDKSCKTAFGSSMAFGVEACNSADVGAYRTRAAIADLRALQAIPSGVDGLSWISKPVEIPSRRQHARVLRRARAPGGSTRTR